MAARPRRQKADKKQEADKADQADKADKGLHPEPLHLAPRPDAKALGDPEPLHPEPLHLEHVGDDEDDDTD